MMSMRSFRKFAYAAVLAASFFSLQPTLASAEDAHGVFTLSHEVHWQNYVLQPGTYAFTVKGMGHPSYLMLQGLNGTGTDATLLVSEFENLATEQSAQSEASKLVLISRGGQSFVSAMDLAGYEMALRFNVPKDGSAK